PTLMTLGLAAGLGSPLLLVALLAGIHLLVDASRAIGYGRFPIDIEADAEELRITCPGQWGPGVQRWPASELRRLEVYEAGRNWDGSGIIYLKVWAGDYFHTRELHFTTHDPHLAQRLSQALHQALRLPRPGHARLQADSASAQPPAETVM